MTMNHLKIYFKQMLNVSVLTTSILLLSACGGNSSKNPAGFESVRVLGDSLADSGVFGGVKATVNNAGFNGSPTLIWTELIAKQLNLTQPCPFYNINLSNKQLSTNALCKSFAVSGARINTFNKSNNFFTPSISEQMDQAVLTMKGKFPDKELILINGGGNDVADIFGAYLAFEANIPTQKDQYSQLLSTLLPINTVQSVIAQPATETNRLSGSQQLGVLYMNALANKMADDINNQLLNKGANTIAIMNIPSMTNTPRFKLFLKNIAASPLGTKGALAAESLVRYWIGSFNQTLNNRFKADKRVMIVDFFAGLDRQMAFPSAYGLSNPVSSITGVIDTACPMIDRDSMGLPVYNVSTCTALVLDQSSLSNKWRTMSFADGLHPTPYMHTLIAQLVNRTLSIRSWM